MLILFFNDKKNIGSSLLENLFFCLKGGKVMANKKEKKEKTVYVGGQVPVSIHAFLCDLALKDDKSLSAVIRTALCEYVANLQKK